MIHDIIPSTEKGLGVEDLALITGGDRFWNQHVDIASQSLHLDVNNKTITANSLLSHLTQDVYDIYPSYDWGRDFGIDNRSRVQAILQQQSNNPYHYRVYKEDYQLSTTDNQQFVIKCRYAIVFLTDRYVRRYSERGFIYEDFNYCLKRSHHRIHHDVNVSPTNEGDDDGPMIMIIVIMEERVNRRREEYFKKLGLPKAWIKSPLCVDFSDLKADAITHAQKLHESILYSSKYLAMEVQRKQSQTQPDMVKVSQQRTVPHSVEEISTEIHSFCARPLLQSIENQNIEEMKVLLAAKTFDCHRAYCFVDSNTGVRRNCYLLHRIVSIGNIAQLECFSTCIEDLDTVDNDGRTALHVACDSNHDLGIALCLLQRGATPNIADFSGNVPLHYAIKRDNLRLVRLLVCYKADIFVKDKEGNSAIEFAKSSEMTTFLEQVVSLKRAILVACQRGDLDQVRNLLASQAEKNLRKQERKDVESVINNDIDDVDYDVNLCNEDGRSPLYFAATNDFLEIVALLLHEGKANPNLVDNWGSSVLSDTAMYHNDVAVLRLLIEAGADIESTNCYGNTPLMNAAQGGNYHMAEALLKAGAQVNLTGSHYYKGDQPVMTPIEVAFVEGRFDIVKLLLDHGAKVSSILLSKLILLHEVIPTTNHQIELLPRIQSLFTSTWTHALTSEKDSVKTLFSYAALSANCFALWFSIIQFDVNNANQHNEPNEGNLVEALVVSLAKRYPHLIHTKDLLGRSANVVATNRHRLAMNALFLWHGRYRPASNRKEHCSATSFVYRAYDEQAAISSSSEEGIQEPVQVAIKCFRYKSHFLCELQMREQYSLDSKFVINSVEHFFPIKRGNSVNNNLMQASTAFYNADDGPEDCLLSLHSSTASSAVLTLDRDWQKDEIEQMYCIIMPYCDRNMFVAIKQERFAGRSDSNNAGRNVTDDETRGSDQEQVKTIFKQIVYAVDHLHRQGIVHGDLKPLNIMRHDSRWKLIDLDASGRIQQDYLCQKYSSAFIPPEALTEVFIANSSQIVVRSPQVKSWLQQNPESKGAINDDNEWKFLLKADPSFDIWSLGVILYQLCSRDAVALFQAGQDDNLLSDTTYVLDNDSLGDSLRSLWKWSNPTKKRKLSLIPDAMARNLISLMLTKDPLRRPTISRILAHPFLSGNIKQIVRGSGSDGIDAAEFDFFLSYRVAADLVLVEAVYESLTEQGYKVWWDKRCLTLGQDWQQSFCEGLMKSRCYVAFLSKAGINHPTNERQSFAFKHLLQLANHNQVVQDAPCDNLLLEIRLALELQRLGYVDRLVPLFIGETSKGSDIENGRQDINFLEFDFPSCWPKPPNIIIQSIEDALERELSNQCLGESILASNRDIITVSGLLSALTKCQGVFVKGTLLEAAQDITKHLASMMSNMLSASNSSVLQLDGVANGSQNHVNTVRRLSASSIA